MRRATAAEASARVSIARFAAAAGNIADDIDSLLNEEAILQGAEDVADQRYQGCIMMVHQREHWALQVPREGQDKHTAKQSEPQESSTGR